jgi:hypothetical protein
MLPVSIKNRTACCPFQSKIERHAARFNQKYNGMLSVSIKNRTASCPFQSKIERHAVRFNQK